MVGWLVAFLLLVSPREPTTGRLKGLDPTSRSIPPPLRRGRASALIIIASSSSSSFLVAAGARAPVEPTVEGRGVEPDVPVDNPPVASAARGEGEGADAQLEARGGLS